MFECLLCAREEPDVRLVGVEVVVDAAACDGFAGAEKARWHDYKDDCV